MNASIRSQQHFQRALMAMSLAAIALTVFFPMLIYWLPQIPTSGHSHVHAHGHAFIDARSLFGIPNCLDVLSNIPFFFAGIWGLMTLRRSTLANATRRAAQVFFVWLAMQPQREGSALNLWAVIAWYALAKLLEAQDAAVFELTQGIFSGHSLKHLSACLAAWPVIALCKKS